jgi:hypothetical protein
LTATAGAGEYFQRHAAARARLEDYLAYGYLEINEYLRNPKAFAATHGAAASREVGKRARALVRDLTKARKTRRSHLCRAQVMSNPEALRMLASRELRVPGPLFVSTDRAVCKRVKSTFARDKRDDQQAAQLDVSAAAVDVSRFGRGRKGEALLPPGTLDVDAARLQKDGTIQVRAHETTRQPRARPRARATKPKSTRRQTAKACALCGHRSKHGLAGCEHVSRAGFCSCRARRP